jgi:CheY-like chemotaxis protein/anti-sigma regulatory factor (Ser/Thr protein kinase)
MPKVLVVDDSKVDRRLVCEFLRKESQWTVEDAANGVEALARMKDSAPDLVLTDLNMPVMDGLELVTALREHHPGVPVILITAYGSETLATEALRRGASSYVPKSQLTGKLLDTMEEVLALARADRTYERLIGCLTRTEFTFRLENDAALIDPLVDLVQQMVAGMDLADFTGRLRIGVALKEALLNALFHGSLEITPEQMQQVQHELLSDEQLSLVEQRRNEPPHRDRKIYVDVRISNEEARFVIRDEGPGFDVSAVPDPEAPGALEAEKGRGLSLMRTFMDKVTFNELGNEVTMVKRREHNGNTPGRQHS